MKKVIRLNESELIQFIGRIVESMGDFEHQEEIDAILEKIKKSGMDSLTDEEKYRLNNPDEKKEYVDLDFGIDDIRHDTLDGVIVAMMELGLFQNEDIETTDENHFFIHNLIDEEGYGLRYFDDGYKLEVSVEFHPNDTVELLVDADPEADEESVEELKDFLEYSWSEARQYMDIHLNF